MTAASKKISWTEGEKHIFRKKPDLTVSQNAERSRIVLKGPKRGPWLNETTPYAVKPMDCFNDPWIRKVILRFPPQSAKTQIALNCLLYAIEHDPADALYVMSVEKTTKKISRRQIIPAIKASPTISHLLSDTKADTKTLSVSFKNGMELNLAWATSAAELASESYKYGFFDEPTKYPRMAGGEADPLYLGEQRFNTFQYTHKIYIFSTPNEEDDALMRSEAEADVKYIYKAACPVCGHLQQLRFRQFTWPETAGWKAIKRKNLGRYQCENCTLDWTDYQRTEAVKLGYAHGDRGWHPAPDENGNVTEVKRPMSVAFHLTSYYSPFISLSKIVADYLQGLTNKAKNKIYVTQHKTEPYKETIIKSDDAEILKAISTAPPRVVPAAAVALVAGIDVQKIGFWFIVRAFAPDFTSWMIDYGFLHKWEDVETKLFKTAYPVDGSVNRKMIWRAAIDTGGGKKYEDMTMTEETYWWIRDNGTGRGARVYATKGSSRPLAGKCHAGKPLDKTPSGKPLPGGLQIIRIDTDQAKDMVYYRLGQAAKQGTYAAYLHSKTGIDYARQITAEEKERQKNGAVTWVEKRKDNHLLDCEVLAHMVVDPEWPGGGLNLVRMPSAAPGSPPPASGRRVISKGISL